MNHRIVLTKVPGRTVYQGQKEGEIQHHSTDTLQYGSETVTIPGKGSLNHRISCFFFSLLNALDVPTHFIRPLNMCESLMHVTYPLPFELLVRCAADPHMAKKWTIQEGKVFHPPIIEYITPDGEMVTESMILALDWMELEELSTVHELTMKVIHILQGSLMAVGFKLMNITLTLGQDDSTNLFVAGQFSLDNLCLLDMKTQQYLGREFFIEDGKVSVQPYLSLAQRLGVYPGTADFFSKSHRKA